MTDEHGPDTAGDCGGDSQPAHDVARWRKAERESLLAARLGLSLEYRTAQTAAIGNELDRLVPSESRTILSVYWPIRAEPDLRAWMRAKWEQGIRVALPVAVALGQPLEFREWRPDARMARGLWKIPYPADGAEVVPTVILAPVIGLGYPSASIPTIYPQPHDIPMSRIVTGQNLSAR